MIKVQKSGEENKIIKTNWCEICDKTFDDKAGIARHIRNVHGEIKIHACNVCNKTFGKSRVLQHHVN